MATVMTPVAQAVAEVLATATQATSADVTTRAMLVDLSIHQWTGVKRDRSAERVVAKHHNTQEDAGHYLKRLGKDTEGGKLFKQMRAKTIELAEEHRRRTAPWHDGGTRILSSAGYFDYVRTITTIIGEYDELADAFELAYPGMIEEDRARLNGMFNANDYPHPSRIRSKFGASYRISTLPTAGDFRVEMSQDEYARVCTHITDALQEGLRGAMKEPWARTKKAVVHMVERLTAYDDRGDKVTGNFHGTLVDNVRELVEILPTLNVVGDAALDAVIAEMRDKLCRFDAVTLKEDPEAREVTARAAQDILDTMSAFV